MIYYENFAGRFVHLLLLMTERTDSSLVVLVSTGLTVGTITTLFTPLDVLKNVVQH